MNDFPGESDPIDGDYPPEQPENAHPGYDGPDSMASPEIYPGQEDDPGMPHYVPEIDTAAFMAEFAPPPEHSEVRPEDMHPITEATVDELFDIVYTHACEGLHFPDMRDDDGVLLRRAFGVQQFISADQRERLTASFYPGGVPQPKGDPLLGSVVITPNEKRHLAAYTETKYRITISVQDTLHVEKHIVLEEGLTPRTGAADGEVPDMFHAVLEHIRRRVEGVPQARAAQQENRELGLAFVPETEARALIDKLRSATPQYGQ